MGMHPGALIPYIDHFKKAPIQAYVFQGLLKSWLMGSRCAGSHNHTVQIMFLYLVLDDALRILGAGIKAAIRKNHPG
jgi:hypothetical protein